jgi:hypothetical protein
MQNAEGGSVSARSDDRYDGLGSIVLEIASLLERVQAITELVESAVAIESSLSHEEIATDLVVLDDVMPRYLNARAALNTCNASLEVTLHLLSDSRTSQHGTDEAAEYELRSTRLVGCA